MCVCVCVYACVCACARACVRVYVAEQKMRAEIFNEVRENLLANQYQLSEANRNFDDQVSSSHSLGTSVAVSCGCLYIFTMLNVNHKGW